jgi:D-arabinono-1,4-lactone oxidase
VSAVAPARGKDGFYHPASEEQLAALVTAAYREGRELRVRGAAHSVAHAVYTDPLESLANHVDQQQPPPGDNFNVMLDLYRGWRVVDEEQRLVEADAGINLGADPSSPTGTATLEKSLLHGLWDKRGWTLAETGGISHQTVSGFTATGSSGGSLQHSANSNLWGFRVIDGTGAVHEINHDDPLFQSMAPNMGLLGVVSKITLRCDETFNIRGQEAITSAADCAVDLFGTGDEKRPSLEQFLRDAEYARVEWWPQRGLERVLVWQAERIPPEPGFKPSPYEEFTEHSEAAQHLMSIFFTVLGNLDDLSRAKDELEAGFDELAKVLDELPPLHALGWFGKALAKFVSGALEFGVDVAITLLEPFAGRIKDDLPTIFPKLVGLFITTDSEKSGKQKGEPQRFCDWAWHGLPMDNQANDVLLPTEFSEAWIPLERTQEMMQLLQTYFTEPKDAHESYARTGFFAWELYSAPATDFWMAASSTVGDDEWKDGAFRVDAYWFRGNAGESTTTFYPQFWNLLREGGIPFRLHWGKFQPVGGAGDRDWVDFFKAQYPHWSDFLKLRDERDPSNIFLNAYWRDRFGLWDAPGPKPIETGEGR